MPQVTNAPFSAEKQASVGDVSAREQAVADKAVAENNAPLSVAVAAIPMIAVACFCLIYTVHAISNLTFYSKVDIDSISSLLKAYPSSWILILMSFGWVVSMGCIGAIASLDMQAIKATKDMSIPEITNLKQQILRVTLGVILALALTFPFESDCFIDLCHYIGTGAEFKTDAEGSFSRAMVLFIPFLLGFSTPLALSIIDQLNHAVSVFFGQLGSGTKEVAGPNTQQSR